MEKQELFKQIDNKASAIESLFTEVKNNKEILLYESKLADWNDWDNYGKNDDPETEWGNWNDWSKIEFIQFP